MKKICLFVLIFVLSLTMTACGSAGGKYSPDGSDPEKGFESSDRNTDRTDSVTVGADRKMTRTISISAETENFNLLSDRIRSETVRLDGYIESGKSNGNGYSTEYFSRSASFVCRIPADRTDEFLKLLDSDCRIISRSENSNDVTLNHVDTQSRISALESEKTALEKLLSEATDTSAILEIRNQLTDVIYKLDSYKSQLRELDNKIDYSTITLDVCEVGVYSDTNDKSFGERVKDGLKQTFSTIASDATSVAVFVIVNLPYALIFAAVCLIIVFAVIRTGKRRSKGGEKNRK